MRTQFLIATTLAVAVITASPCQAGGVDASPGLESLNDPAIVVTAPVTAPASPDVFGTVALNAGITLYDVRWRRVSAADRADPRVLSIAAHALGLDPLSMLNAVQSEVRRRIVWKRDLDGYKISDYWAEAGETLTRGYGDAEDIAVLKIQALKAAGFNPRDLYISVGRDRARGLDTLLVARANGRFYVLDDRAERPMTPEQHNSFEPIITLGKGVSYLHGKRYRRLAARAR
ncbi:MAG: transglutaminase-like cysteine peptidase [Sphingomicrobium sp.]